MADAPQTTTELVILGRITSINVRKVCWTADLIGLSYRTEVWVLPHRDPREAEFLKRLDRPQRLGSAVPRRPSPGREWC